MKRMLLTLAVLVISVAIVSAQETRTAANDSLLELLPQQLSLNAENRKELKKMIWNVNFLASSQPPSGLDIL